MKETRIEKLAPRTPRQQRAQHKVELILEAAMRLLDKGGLAALTTNAVAELAGVSIGTLYQYFANKEAILDALADRERAGLSERVVQVLDEPDPLSAEERVGRVIQAVTASYGGRTQVHRLVMQHSLALGGTRLAPVVAQLVEHLAARGRKAGDGRVLPTSHADAFVLTNAFAGVMRAMIMREDASSPPRGEIEAALARLIVNFAEAD